jgi:hypothetical protein
LGETCKNGVTDAQAAFLANHPPGDTSIYQDGPRKGQKWTFENALADAKQDPKQFRLVFGNYDTFGNDWSTYTPEQQDAIVSRLANENLYGSKKGDVIITDKARARQIKDEVLSGKTATAVTPEVANVTAGQTQKPVAIAPQQTGIYTKPLIVGRGQAPTNLPPLQVREASKSATAESARNQQMGKDLAKRINQKRGK